MKLIHNCPLPEASQPSESDQLGQRLAKLGLLNDDSAAVESISSKAADLSLDGQIRWGPKYAEMIAAELDELADASLPPLALRSREGAYQNQGWYGVENATIEPLHANKREVWQYSLSLTKASKRGSSFRALSVNSAQRDHPWGNTTDPILIGVPASADKVRWFHETTEQITPASQVETRGGEHVDAAMYNITAGEDALGVEAPTLIYDVSYENDVRGGVRAYDSRGRSKFANSGSGPRQWQTIHSTEHDITDPIVVSNGRFRLQLDESSTPHLSADSWDDSAGSWATISELETAGSNTDWTLYDIDLTDLGLNAVDAQLEFQHPSNGLYDLNMSLQFGRGSVLFWRPQDESGAVPSGLVDWLSSIAADWIMDPQQARELVARKEVRS